MTNKNLESNILPVAIGALAGLIGTNFYIAKQGEKYIMDRVYNTPIIETIFTNPEYGFYDFYANERVKQSQALWHEYINRVREINPGLDRLRLGPGMPNSTIRLPDLDRDGKVSKKQK